MINNNLLRYLCCPKCKSDLSSGDKLLVCNNCQEQYEINNGVPVLIDLSNLPPHLRGQIKYFETESRDRKGYKLDEWQKSYIRRLELNFKLEKGEYLIDAGTGSGYIAIEMARRGLNVIACDLNLDGLIKLREIAENENLENLIIVCCTAENLPIKDKVANYLVSNAVLEHLPKEEEAIFEIDRVCKDSSGLMITVPIKYKYILPIFWLPTYIHDRSIGHLRNYDTDELGDRFKRYSYKKKEAYYPGHIEKSLVVSLSILGLNRESWNRWCEVCDERKEHIKYGSSNLCVIFNR